MRQSHLNAASMLEELERGTELDLEPTPRDEARGGNESTAAVPKVNTGGGLTNLSIPGLDMSPTKAHQK